MSDSITIEEALERALTMAQDALSELEQAGMFAVSYEAIRLWCNKFGSKYARRLRRNHQGYGDTFFIDEVFVKIQGR